MNTETCNKLERAKKLEKFIEIYKESGESELSAELGLIEACLAKVPLLTVPDPEVDYAKLLRPEQEIILALPASGAGPYTYEDERTPWAGMTGVGMAGTEVLARALLDGKCQIEANASKGLILARHALHQADGLLEAAASYPQVDDELYEYGAAVAEGGILKVLFEMVKLSGHGMRINYESVPIKQITVEICEYFDYNPWQLLSGGCVLYVTSKGSALVRSLEKQGFEAHRIGFLTEDKKKLICHSWDPGMEEGSCINRPEPDDLLKMLKERI